jgi:uncharacterized protein (TIGR02466 family)
MKALDKAIRQCFVTEMFLARVDDYAVLDRAIEDIKILEQSGSGHRNDFVWTSDDNLHTLPQFKEITELFHREAGDVLDYMGIKRDSHEITCMWSNNAQVGQQHIIHYHANSFLSGLLYLEVPEGSGHTIFQDPRPAVGMWDPDYVNKEKFRTAYISQKPEKGMLTIFPSWLPHGVDIGKNYPDKRRIILSFNVMIRGEMTQHSKRLVL